jgi:formate hydrogenlyase subunit 4
MSFSGDMTGPIVRFILLLASMAFLPFFSIGLIRKLKARMQNRIGAPLLQPFYDFAKLANKDQTVSATTTTVFLLSSAINVSVMILIAILVPWVSFKPSFPGDDLFLLLYLLALLRFMIILSALDAGSSFGAFAASREAYLAMLVEPAMFISLAALGLLVDNSSLSVIFAFSHPCTVFDAPVWLSAALALFLASMVDLSRMPIDDPTTHLELTMVHEAMILENSGKNLALVEFAHLLKMVVLYGLSAQCLLHAATFFWPLSQVNLGILSVVGILVMATTTAMIEAVAVKLQWRRTPEFIAFALTISLFATVGALIGGLYARHYL